MLARNLIGSLDNEETEEDTDELWIEEADWQYQELKEGKVKGNPASQVFDEIRKRFL